MGTLQKRLDIFQEEIITAYQDILKILEDKYCWKCPMRSTRMNSRCREVHAGRVIRQAMDEGIVKNPHSNLSPVEVNALIARIQKKMIKKKGGSQREKTIIIQDENQNFNHNNWLMVKIYPKRVLKGEKIIIPQESFTSPLTGACALIAGFPFKIGVTKRVFHEGNFWYVEVEEKEVWPLESVCGVLVKGLKEGDSLKID